MIFRPSIGFASRRSVRVDSPFQWGNVDRDVGVPQNGRSDICTILIAAADKSSFNIFMIAGVGKLSFVPSKMEKLGPNQKLTIVLLHEEM
jgi:hypothetical protein